MYLFTAIKDDISHNIYTGEYIISISSEDLYCAKYNFLWDLSQAKKGCTGVSFQIHGVLLLTFLWSVITNLSVECYY